MSDGRANPTVEHRRKISEALPGRPKSAEHRQPINEGLRGGKLTKRHRKNVAEGVRRYWDGR